MHLANENESGSRSGICPQLARQSGEGTRPLGSGHEVLLQAFNWESWKGHNGQSWYRHLKHELENFRKIGVTVIWLPPPSDSVSNEGYLPRTLESLNSKYGTAEELKILIDVFQKAGISAIVDCVLNHRCADQQDAEGRWNVFSGEYAWGANEICCNNPVFGGSGNHKEGEDFQAAPNLDHQSSKVSEGLKHWLKWLRRELNASGFRFDFVKGYAGDHVRDYIKSSTPMLAVGEFWDACAYDEAGHLLPNQDEHRQRTVDWVDSTGGSAAAFDFTTKAILQEAVGKHQYWRLRDGCGKAAGLMGWWPAHAVSFLDNHDTGSTQQHWPFPPEHLSQGYAYILTHPGMPCVFIDHISESECGNNGDSLRKTITELLKVRKTAGISATSTVAILEANDELYAAFIDQKVALKLGPAEWSPEGHFDGDWRLCFSGKNFAVWMRAEGI